MKNNSKEFSWNMLDDFYGNMDDHEVKPFIREEDFEKIVSFSPEMSAYRKELQQVIQSLKSIGALGLIFDNALLVSIDDGWGYSEFTEMISKELNDAFELKYSHIGMEKEKYPTGIGRDTWECQYDRIKRISDGVRKGGKFAILTYDLSDAASEMFTPEFKKRMCEVKTLSKDIFFIIRIPYMDKNALMNYERVFEDIMSVRLVAVPPVSIENMVIYLREGLQRVKIQVDEACNDLLEQWICQEKSEGVFYGYQTLDKMISELIYQKALCATVPGDGKGDMECVTATDIQKMLDDSIMAENGYELLNELVGITQLKTRVREIVAQIKMQKELVEKGKEIEKPSMHMMFLGNPGTGKTTVARIIGQIFKQEGLLRKGHFIEMRGGDFIFGKIGDTIAKIRTVCRDSYGSVLFLDEAYGMSIGYSGGNISDEILPTLVAETENHREDMCVIFAGYKDEMEAFLKENSGLKSRIPHVLEFPNYTRDELIEIFFQMVEGKFEYEDDLKETLCEYIYNIPDASFHSKEFSNARFIRNLYERLWGKAAYRISMSGEQEIVLKKEDMVCVVEEEDFQAMVTEKKKKTIGFGVR